MFTWIYASYDAHNKMRSHTGGDIYMGYGIIYRKYPKQNIDVQSSTEVELVGMSEYIPSCVVDDVL